MNNKINKISPLPNMLLTIGLLPSSYIVSMTYEEQLLWLCNFLKTEVIPKTNANIEAVNQLITYIDNYFDNLDVQEEINNKLDEMATDGTLEEIISSYLNTNALITFNTLSDLKSATNLINGSKVKTLGYYNLNDGGGATYFVRNVTNQDTANDMNIIALNDENLIAEIVKEKNINILQFGAKGDNNTDNTNILQFAINYNDSVFIPKGTYKISDTITINPNTKINGESMKDSKIINTSENYVFKYITEVQSEINDSKVNIKLNNFYCESKYFVKINEDNLEASQFRLQSSLLHLEFSNLFLTGNYIRVISDTNLYTSTIPTLEELKGYGIAFNLNNIFDSSIKNCNIQFYGIGTYLKGSDINNISDNRFMSNANHIYLERVSTYGSQNRICHNDILNNGRYGGITINNTAFDTIEDNYFETYHNSATFIYGINERGLSILNNRFDSPNIANINFIKLSPYQTDIIKNNILNRSTNNPTLNIDIENLNQQLYINSAIVKDNNGFNYQGEPLTITNDINHLKINANNIFRQTQGSAYKSPYFVSDENNLYYFYVDSEQSPTPSLLFVFTNLQKYYGKATKIRFKYKSTGASQFYCSVTSGGVSKYAGNVAINNDGNLHDVTIELSDNSLLNQLVIELPRNQYHLYEIELI